MTTVKPTDLCYKAVRKDRTSHYDKTTKWRVGSIVQVADPDPASNGVCGRGIHCSRKLLDAVVYQCGPSRYAVVQPLDVITSDDSKLRCGSVRVIRWLSSAELDELAGFRLHEANTPVNPFLRKPKRVEMGVLLRKWVSVRDSVGVSVWDSVRDSVWASVRASVRDSVGASVRASVRDSVGASVRASVGDSVGAYVGGLFPSIQSWTYAESLGSDPWRPLLTLWYAGYIPSFDGKMWRVHAGRKAEVVYTWKPKT